ncbi:cell division protein FtsX [Sphingomonas sp. FW199]|uniref:cell division protein FtsX n=1 Tax=Sphingomonas sp. FW199 TaxID=3400217 RepID=UPI003CF66BAD
MKRLDLWLPSPADRRLLDERHRTRAMLWTMAIMLFLTTLAAAAGLMLARAGQSLDRQLAGRLTVQLIDGDAAARDRAAAGLARQLRSVPQVAGVRPVERAAMAQLLQPWLGDAGLDPDLPLPAMIDVDVAGGDAAAMAAVEQAVRRLSPGAQVERHARWLAPVRSMFRLLGWLALGIVVLMVLATTLVVVLAVRSGLDTHRLTIDVLHLLGAMDKQVARLFEARIALDTLIGGLIGSGAAALVLIVVQWQAAAMDSAMIEGGLLGPRDALALIALPVAFGLAALIAARIAVMRALEQVP